MKLEIFCMTSIEKLTCSRDSGRSCNTHDSWPFGDCTFSLIRFEIWRLGYNWTSFSSKRIYINHLLIKCFIWTNNPSYPKSYHTFNSLNMTHSCIRWPWNSTWSKHRILRYLQIRSLRYSRFSSWNSYSLMKMQALRYSIMMRNILIFWWFWSINITSSPRFKIPWCCRQFRRNWI